MDIQPTITSQIIAWVNGLTIPGIIFFVWRASGWLTKREDAAKAEMASVKQELELHSTNHFPHMQDTLTRIELAQGETTRAVLSSQNEITKAIQASQTAIVQAILTQKSA